MFKYLWKPLRLYTTYESYLSIRYAIILVLIALAAGIIGFMIIEEYAFIDAAYMTVITISTVGFEEVRPLSKGGQVFAIILILLNIGVFAYALSAFTAYVIQGELFKNVHMAFIKDQIKQLKNHVILCGYGNYGREVADHFVYHNIDFVVIEHDDEKINHIRKDERKLLYIHDDATHDEVLIAAGIKSAKAIISALASDQDNLFTVFTAKQLNPDLNIISRAIDPKSDSKLKLAGATHVILPDQIGGFYMATLVTSPGAVDFFSFITNEYESDIGFRVLEYADFPPALHGKSIYQLSLREKTGINIIGHRSAGGMYHVNPGPDVVLKPGSSFIVLGDEAQLQSLKNFLESKL